MMKYLTVKQKQKELDYWNDRGLPVEHNGGHPPVLTLDKVRFVKNWVDRLTHHERRYAYKQYLEQHERENPDDIIPYRKYNEWLEMEDYFVYGEMEDNGGRIFVYQCET